MDSLGSAARLRAAAARRRRFTVRSLRRRIGGLEWLEPRLALTAETEPNNTLGTANGFTGSSGTLTGRIDNQVDVDYFSTALEAGQTLSLRYTENDSDGTPAFLPTMEILSPSGEVKAASMDAHSFSYTPGIAGTYGVRLTSQSTYGNITGDYDITYTLTAFTGVTESESNNTQGTANSLSTQANFRGSLASSSDADFFSFTVSAGQAVAVKFAEKPTLNPAVRLYAPGGTLLATDRSGVGLATSISTTGTYAIAIQSDNTAGTVTGSYAGQVLIATSPVLDGETGDLFESSTTLNLGPYVVPGIYLSPDSTFTNSGLTGSYVNKNLRGVADTNFVATQTIAGTRLDQTIHFPQDGWGPRSSVGLTNGNDDNWDTFSVQWDGYIRIPAAGTQVYLSSDDGSRMWIDANGDNSFAAGELTNNNWGSGQGNTLSAPSAALAPGDYKIRIQYEEGGGGNSAFVMWSDSLRSAGIVSENQHSDGVGVLSSLTDVDVYSVNLSGTGFYEFRLDSTTGGLSTQNRLITLYNELGQPLEYSYAGRIATDRYHVRVETTAKYYVTVQALSDTGLGPYELVATIQHEFPVYRDVPLFYQDYTGYNKQAQVPIFMAFYESRYDVYQVDLTQTDPGNSTESVDWLFPDNGSGCGGSEGGWYGTRRPSGSGSGRCTWADWQKLSDVWFGLFYHENGHGVGLLHSRTPLDVMSYGGQLDYFPVGSFNQIGGIYGNGDSRTSVPKPENNRNHLDWVLESGRIALEEESNDTLATAQRVSGYLSQMTADADARNDQVVVVSSLTTKADVDVYRFTAAAGETWSIDVDSNEFQMWLDSKLEIVDGSGTVLASSQSAIDRDTGLTSVDPFLTYQFGAAGDYYARVRAENWTFGNYRLKLTPQRAFDATGPKIAAQWPDGGTSVDGTRQLIFWTNDQLDPATLTSSNIIVTGAVTGVRTGTATFNPLTSTVIWRSTSTLPPDTYTVRLKSGVGGITDLRGNQLDGDTDGTLSFPEVSGNGTAGGDFVSTFTINQADTSPAALSFSTSTRMDHDRQMFEFYYNDELDIQDIYSRTFTLRGSGPDRTFNTGDDTFSPVDVMIDERDNTNNHLLRVYSRGMLDPDRYRVEATFLDAAGNTVNLSQAYEVTVTVPTGSLFTTAAKTVNGLTGSYVNSSLRNYALQDDWRSTQTIAGTRVDPVVDFYSSSLGIRSQVGVTGGTDADWDGFSVQWDGYLVVPANGVRVFTRSDDGSRMWIDVNGDGNFAASGNEFINNGWGGGQGATTGPASIGLNAGTYKIRVQYEEGSGSNTVQLMWDYNGPDSVINGMKTSPQVVDVSVQPNTVLNSSPAAIDVTFSQAIVASSLTTSSFRLRYSLDPIFFNGNDSFINDLDGTIAWDATQRKATFQPASTLLNGYYLLELDGDTGGIVSPQGRLLDGEYRDGNIAGFTSPFGWNDAPSGDGLPGGDYRAMFIMSAPDLEVIIPTSSIVENAGASAATGTVTRYGSLDAPLIVTLVSSDTTEATVPMTVTIPAGVSTASFPIDAVDDTLLDGSQSVTITASATGVQSGSAGITVTDYETLGVSILPTSISENGGTATGAVVRNNTDLGQALVVTLASSDTTEATVPATVTIPANESTATFTITAVDDTLLDGIQSVTISVSEPRYVGASANMSVTDSETITISLAPSTISESGGTSTATVTRSNTDRSQALVVTLSSSDTSEATVPATVTIPVNQASVTFTVTAVDDTLLDGTQAVVITGTVSGYSDGTANLSVTDLETLTVSLNPTTMSENGGSVTGTVTRSNTDNGEDLVVTLASNDTTEAPVPATVTIPANQASATFTVSAVDDTLLDGSRVAGISVAATGYVGSSANVTVTDYEPITVSVNVSTMSEKSGTATGTVTRGNTDISSSLVVTLTNSDTTEATFTNTVTIAANQTSATFTITSVDDTILDGTQTITISASATGYVGSSTTLDVTDFETLTVSVNPVAMSENGGTATGTVTRGNTDRSQPLVVTLTSGDTTEATMGATVTIAANQASATFPINAVDDNLFDGVQVVSIGVSAAGYVSGSTTISVTDAESVSLSANVTSISERGGTATGTVTRSNTDGATDLVVTITGNDATEATAPSSVTIPAGQQSATFTITAVDDTLLDGSRAVTFTAAATGYSGGILIVTVTDYESLTVTLNQSTLSEKGGTTTATITRSNTDNSAALTVTLASGDTSEATTPASVTIPANIASATFTVTTVDDTLLDGTQTVAISGSAANYVSVPANLDVTDFETLSLVINPTSISENGGSATATVTRNNTDLGQELVVNVASNDTTEASVPATVTIPANQASTTFTVSAVDDTLLDGTRTAAISVTSPGYIAAGGNVLVSDYESLSIALDTNSVAENAGSITGTVTRSNTDNSSPLTVTLAGNDATEATVPATVVIPANESSATFTVTIVDDNVFDGTQTVTITATATSYVSGSVNLDVTDFEQLTIAVSPSSISENGGTATGTVTRNNTDRSQALTVSLASTDPSQASLPESVTIPANATSATFSISAHDDTLLDGDQSLTLTASAAGYVAGTTVLVVTDHETLTVTLDVSSISENGGSTTGTVRRNNTDLTQSLTVTLTSSDTTEATAPASVTIAAGEATATFTVTAVEDFAADGSQSATIGATATGYVGGSANITVTDFNHPPTDLTLDKTTVAENASAAIVGAVNVVDPDAGETFSFTLSDSRFEVVGGNLRLKTGQTLDFETEPNVSVTITARDSGNAQIARTFSLQTTDVNERPTNIQLSSNSVTENVAGAAIGDLSVVDPDAGDSHTLSVADARFEIVNGQLRLKTGQSLDYEAGATVSVDVTARDAGGLEFTKSLSITVGDANDAPTAIQVTPSSVRENLVGATIGQLSATDQDVGQTHSFTTSDSRFEIVGSTLRFKSDQYADFGAGSTITVSIQTTDNGSPSQSLTQNVVITVIANPFPWQNPIQALDTDNDNQHAIAPVDILLIINLLNGPAGFIDQSGRLPRTRPATSTLPFYDTNGDSFATPQDALLIINYLNRLAAGGEGELPEPAFAPNPNALNPSSPMPANITGGAAIHDAVLDELTLDGVIAEIAADVARRRLTWSSRLAR